MPPVLTGYDNASVFEKLNGRCSFVDFTDDVFGIELGEVQQLKIMTSPDHHKTISPETGPPTLAQSAGESKPI